MIPPYWYVDTSAAAKLIQPERETRALRRWLMSRAWIMSDLHRTELRRAAARTSRTVSARADRLLSDVDLIAVDATVLDSAGQLSDPSLRSLDAIHLAAALQLGDDLAGIVAYDQRLLDAASGLGLRVASPTPSRSEQVE